MRRVIGLLALVAGATIVSAQDYRVEVRLVEVEVKVTDSDGRPIPDLDRNDFRLREDGLEHDIANVQFVPPPEPLTAVVEHQGETVEEEVPVLASPTWVYVATEIGPRDVQRVQQAIREFLINDLPPGFRVSIGGRPFSDDRAQLLDTLAWLTRNPNGRDGKGGLTDVTGPLVDDVADQRAIAANFRRQETGTSPLMGFTSRPQSYEPDASLARPFITDGQIQRQLPVYGDLALIQYFDIVDQLAALPGKKAIILMRPGLRLEPDNQALLNDLAGFSARRRVSFYTVDSRGLDAPIPVDDYDVPAFIDRRRRPGEPDILGQMEMRDLARSGMRELARETGGRALIGTNRLADAFDAVEQDASGYYVISYYPVDLSAKGRFRTIDIDVDRPRAKLKQVTRGYYEPRPRSMFPKEDRGLALRQAMQADVAPHDLPAAASVSFFASPEGWPVLIIGAGVPASQLNPQKGEDSSLPSVSVKAMVRVSDKTHERLPMYFERTLSAELAQEQWQQLRDDPTAFLSMSDMLPLLPGEYDWRIVFRDEDSGRIGRLDGSVMLRDFRGASTPSTMLLTREVNRLDQPAAGEERNPLDAGSLRFLPQASPVFKQGETVHLLYALYNASQADFDAATRGMRVGLFRNGKPVTGVETFGSPLGDPQSGTIRFTGFIRTGTLAPGTYMVVGLLPNAQTGQVQHVQQLFVLLPADGGA
jgi:VWFA-related protein